MSKEWKEVELGDCCEILSSKRIFAKDYVEEGIPFYRSKEIIQKALGQFSEDELYITQKRFNDIKEKFGAPVKGDLLISAVGNRSGIPYCVKEEYDFYFKDGNLIWFRDFGQNLDSSFLEFFLSSRIGQSQIDAMMIGSAQKALTIAGVKKIKIKVPPLEDQKAIAHILGKLDDKIELNRQMNQTLEQMAQALFQSWFVDFDPVLDNAITQGNEIPESLHTKAENRRTVLNNPLSGGDKGVGAPLIKINPELAAQFSSTFTYNETLGKYIPEGWEVDFVKNHVSITKGKSYKSSELESSKTALVTLKSFNRGGGYRLDGLKEYTGKYKDEQVVQKGDLIISYTDVTQAADIIGKPALVMENKNYEKLVISLDVAVIRPDKDELKMYLYYMACANDFQMHTYGHSTGTTVLHLSKDAVGAYEFPIPNESLIKTFSDIAQNSFKRINANIQQTATLERLREVLLPQLISGKVKVPEALLRVQEVVG